MEQIKSQTIKQDTPNDIVSLFKDEFTSTVIPVYVKSLDTELNFREVTVGEYKKFAKIAIDNSDKPATIYRAMSALIENVMLSKVDFGALTELDRIHILFNLSQTMILDQQHKVTCPSCGNSYILQPDFKKINDGFDALDLTDKVYTIEDANRLYIFTVNFPTIRRMMETLDYFQKHNHGKITDSDTTVNANTFGIAMMYIHAYIKSITIERKQPGKKNATITANFNSLPVDKIEEIVELIPQSIFNSSSETSLVSKINADFISKANSVFQKEKCPSCGAEFQGIVGSISDFLFS
jgi:predicted RNA-binding Zn-ribbon protein involved in translation (DUF1610 family)